MAAPIDPDIATAAIAAARESGREVVAIPLAEIAARLGISRATLQRRIGSRAALHAAVRAAGVDPAANRFRCYVLAWRPTLWGDFALVQTWGRLGHRGRSHTSFYASRAEAQGAIVRLLRRRLRRGYRVVAWT